MGQEGVQFFGIYHTIKLGKIVFDSRAHYDGVSVNNARLPFPDLNNSLQRVLGGAGGYQTGH